MTNSNEHVSLSIVLLKLYELETSIDYRLIPTGQHYDKNMSGDFFEQLEIPPPHRNLKCGKGSQSEQTAHTMIVFKKELEDNPTDFVLVVGDVTSTTAWTIVAQKSYTKVAHVEAGIRSFDWSMPEEINRLLTTVSPTIFFTTSETANKHLCQSGLVKKKNIGNTMINTSIKQYPNFIKPRLWDEFNLLTENYWILTLHRPSNVDNEWKLKEFKNETIVHSENEPLIFPMHPRTASIFKT